MNILRAERDTLDAYLPGLDKYLSETPLLELEKPGSQALRIFKELGGPALLIPAEYGGKGASAIDAVRIQRAVGSRSPSLAVATTMHHFSVASLVELTAAGNGFEWVMLTAIAENSWLLSSGFAEGKPGQHILTPAMRGVKADGGIVVSGTKKPCSLTWSMNLMSASVAVADPATGTGADRLAIVLIPADSAGIERAPFWRTTALAAAESDQVTLTDVYVPEALIFYPQNGQEMDPVQARGFVWFELLVSASYLGAATNLAERVITRGRGSDEDRAGLAIELESAAAALEQAAAATAGDNDALLARALCARYATERAIERAAMSAAAALGGMEFIGSPEVAYLLGVSRALAFHPPSRSAAVGPIARYLAGAPLIL
jgi:alkylation response protein AidB-like acyl-CoA dehydrogenase